MKRLLIAINMWRDKTLRYSFPRAWRASRRFS